MAEALVPQIFHVKAPLRNTDEWLAPEVIRIVAGATEAESFRVEVDCENLVGTDYITAQGNPDNSQAPAGVTAAAVAPRQSTAIVLLTAAAGASGEGYVFFSITTSTSGPMIVGFRIEVLGAAS